MNLNQLKARINKVRKSGRANSIGVGNGAYLQVKGDALSWVFRYRFNGKARMIGMGAYDALTMAEAQDKGYGYRKLVTNDIDPQTDRDDAAAATAAKASASKTLAHAINAYLDPKDGGGVEGFTNEKHRKQWRATLICPELADLRKMPCSQIETAHIVDALRPIWSKRKTAKRLRGRLEQVLNFAAGKKWRTGPNPALSGLVKVLLPKDKVPTVNHAALDWDRVPKFMANLRKREGNAARCLELITLCAARRKEIHGLKFSEFDPVKKTITIPASRMKRRRQHVIPVSQRAIAIIEERRALTNGDLVFQGEKAGKPFGASAMTTLLRSFHRRAKVVNEATDEVTLEKITIHGFRSSFSGWAAESGQHPDAKEHALAHRKEGIKGVYERVTFLDRRVHIMSAWADYCECGNVDNVQQIRAA